MPSFNVDEMKNISMTSEKVMDMTTYWRTLFYPTTMIEDRHRSDKPSSLP